MESGIIIIMAAKLMLLWSIVQLEHVHVWSPTADPLQYLKPN